MLKVLRKDYDPESKDPKPSQLIEFAHTQIGTEKHTLQLYEVGDRPLVPFIRRFKSQKEKVVCLVCVDATKGGQLIETTGWYMKQIREAFENGGLPSLAEKRGKNRDSELIQPIPVMTGVVGCKWDLFEKMKSDQKSWTGRGLRYMAHTNSCSVLSCSSKNSKLGHDFRTSFQTFLLGSDAGMKASKDTAKPIFIQFGEDQVDDMKLPTMGNLSGLEALQDELGRVCGQDKPEKEPEEDVPEIDGAVEEAVRAKRKVAMLTDRDWQVFCDRA